MSQHDWNRQVDQTRQGFGSAPQQPGESAQSKKDRDAGHDWANKNK